MALLSSVYLFFLGIASVAWAVSSKAEDAELKGWGSTIVGFYCMALAVAIVLFEWKFGMQVPLLQVRQRLVGRGAPEAADDALTRASRTCVHWVCGVAGHAGACAWHLPDCRIRLRLFLGPDHPCGRVPGEWRVARASAPRFCSSRGVLCPPPTHTPSLPPAS